MIKKQGEKKHASASFLRRDSGRAVQAKKKKEKKHLKTAEYIMIKNVPTVFEDAKVSDVRKLLSLKAKSFKTVNYVYVITKTGLLKGAVSIKEIFQDKGSVPVKKIMSKKVISVRARTNQERAAFLAIKNNLKAVPVVDKNNRFLGVVTSDTILEIADSEALENYLRLGGVYGMSHLEDIEKVPIWKSLKYRLPWLLFGLVGGFFITRIIKQFDVVLSENLIFAAFMPLVVYMASAVGTQTQSLIIRDLSFNAKVNFAKIFLKQLFTVLCLGFIIGLIFHFVSALIFPGEYVYFILSVSLLSVIASSVFTGMLVPYFFYKINTDPAHASGPIATIIQDSLSVLVYFSVITLMI